MRLPKELTKVTPLSKTLAMLVFVVMPFVGFFLGMRYQEMVDLITQQMNSYAPASVKREITPTPLPAETSVKEGDITVNWKTYSDPKYNFTVQYPSTWYAGDFSGCTYGLYGVFVGTEASFPLCNPEIAMPEITIVVLSKDIQKICGPQSQRIVSRKDIQIANTLGKLIVIDNSRGTGKNETVVGFEHSNYCYTITNTEQLAPDAIFDQILFTFKFTK